MTRCLKVDESIVESIGMVLGYDHLVVHCLSPPNANARILFSLFPFLSHTLRVFNRRE